MSALSTNSYQFLGESLRFEKKKVQDMHLNLFANVQSQNLANANLTPFFCKE
jgi:hypothetical protein